MPTKQLTHFLNFFAKFDCKVEQGQESIENPFYMEDVPFARFDEWLTIYHDESTNTFVVEHITSTGGFAEIAMGEEPEYETFTTTSFYEALTYAGCRMVEWHASAIENHLADEEERNLFLAQ